MSRTATCKFMMLHGCVLLWLLVGLPGRVFAQSYLSVLSSNRPYLVDLRRSSTNCCGAKSNSIRSWFMPVNLPEYEIYKLTATYYSLRDDLTTTLMLNNKGAEPILAWPTFYSLGGTRLQLAPITVGAASFLDVDMHKLLASAGDEFREGSLNIAYQGGNQQLGAQVKMVDRENHVIWAEQFVYGSKFISSRLESVWWLPFAKAKLRMVVSNTSSYSVTAHITVDGTAPEQIGTANIMLGPWETRVLDVMTDLAGHQEGVIKSKGGISITHTGSPGTVLARLYIAELNRGYSAAFSFIDPEMTASQRWHGNGLRLKNLDGTNLEPVIALRNTSNQVSRIQGRIIYAQQDGSTGSIEFRRRSIAPGDTGVFNLDNLIKSASVPNTVTYGGIELEYDTFKGTIIASVQSVSESRDHVFQVPMFDPKNMPASAGGFPWKADGDYTTVVYVKNETAVARKFVSHLIYDGGQYSLGVRNLRPGQTAEIDFRQLRDNRSPDSVGNVIPLEVDRGQIAWSVLGAEDKVLSGRSEQISLTDGVASTYACANCCPNVIDEVYVNPLVATTQITDATQFTSTQTETNCYGTPFGPYQANPYEWTSSNSGVATIDFSGNSDAVGVGDTDIGACVERTIWYNWGGGYCEPFTDQLCDQSPMEVQPKVTWETPGGVGSDGGGVPLATGNPPQGSLAYVTTTTITATGTPSGGSYSWSTASDKVTLSNTSSATVTVTAVSESGSTGDVTINLVYTHSSKSTPTVPIPFTVQRPNSMGFVSSGAGTAGNCPSGESGNKKDIVWQVKDHLGNPISFRLPLFDTLTNTTPNTCFNPAAGEGTDPGGGTGTGGRWGHKYRLCSTACNSGGSCSVTGSQKYFIQGFEIDLSYTMTCTSITVNGH